MNGIRHSFAMVLFLLLVLPAPPRSPGGEQTNIRGIGMARTFVADSRGLDAVGLNPANLGIPDSGRVTVAFMPSGVHIGSDVLTYGMYRDYFTGVDSDGGRVSRFLTDADKQRIIGAFQDGVGRVSGELEARPIGISVLVGGVGRFCLTVTERLGFDAQIPQEYARFLLYGNTPGSVYDVSATGMTAQWTREFGFSFGRPVPPPSFLKSMAAGIGVKYVQGFGYYELHRMNASLTTATDGVLRGSIDMMARSADIDQLHRSGAGAFTPFPAPAGTGWGFDAGISGEVNDYLRVGLAVTDIGWIDWQKNVEVAITQSSFVLDNPLMESQRKAVEQALKGTRGPGDPFTTSLPTKLRAGVALEMSRLPAFRNGFSGEMTVALDYNQGFNDVPGSTTHARFSLGVEYRPIPFLPLRTGIEVGGEDGFNFALGLGLKLGFFELDIASDNLGWIFDRSSFSRASAAFGLKFRI